MREADQQNRTYTGVVTARIQSELGSRIPGKLKRLVADLSLDRHILQEIVAKKL